MKMSWTEWKEYEEKRRKLFSEAGVTDIAAYRAKARWRNSNVHYEEVGGLKFVWDHDRREFVKED